MENPDTRKVFVIRFLGGKRPREVRIFAEDLKRARDFARAFKKTGEYIGEVTEESANA